MTTQMMTIVTGFNDQTIANQAIDALRKEGFQGLDVTILKGDADKLVSQLSERGFSKSDAREFADAAGEGKTLVAASLPEEKAKQAVAIMDRYETQKADSGQDNRSEDRQETVPVVEEELSVGKSKTANGGVRVTSSVTEKPVKETVSLKEEQVGVERHSADRKLSADEADAAFKEKTIEMMGAKEEAEVQKEARVVGEVEVNRETEERKQTISDTVRKTDVEVEEVEGAASKRK